MLYDSKGKPISLPTTNHEYIMKVFDTTCSKHGTYIPDQKICICDEDSHRTGPFCDHCQYGFNSDRSGVCIPTESCTLYTCGCYDMADGYCNPIGNCTDNPATPLNRISCKCPDLITGSRCEKCVDGYLGHPYCKPKCSCENGICVSGVCQCLPGFSGNPCVTTRSYLPILLPVLITGLLMCAIAFGIYRVARQRQVVSYIEHENNELDNVNDLGTDLSTDLGVDNETQRLEISKNENSDDDNSV